MKQDIVSAVLIVFALSLTAQRPAAADEWLLADSRWCAAGNGLA